MSTPSEPTKTQATDAIDFAPRTSVEQVEEVQDLAPKFDRDGLIACVTTDAASCHVGYRSCFSQTVALKTGHIAYAETEKTFDSEVVYGDAPNPTVL